MPRGSQLFVELEGEDYGMPVCRHRATTMWMTPTGVEVERGYAANMVDKAAIAGMKYLSYLASMLYAVMLFVVEAVRGTSRAVIYSRGSISDFEASDVSEYFALASIDERRLVSRWELGYTSESEVLFWSTTVQIELEGGGRTGFLSPSGSWLPHPREWTKIEVLEEMVKWILIVEKDAAHPLAVGRRSLLNSYPGGIILTVHGSPGYIDRAIVAALAASFPEAQIIGLFHGNLSGALAYMCLKAGSRAIRHVPEVQALHLGKRIRNCTPIPEMGAGRPLTLAEKRTLGDLRALILTSDPDHDHFSRWLAAGRSATIQGHGGDKTSWITSVIEDLGNIISNAIVASTYVNILPTNDQQDANLRRWRSDVD